MIYKFRVRSKNAMGWSVFSNIANIQAASLPANPSVMTTSIDSVTGGVVVSWTAPYNNAQTIEKYQVLIFNKITNDWTEDNTYCNGSDSTILAKRNCTFPMQVLRDTYGYNFGDLVTFKYSAYNTYGWSV